MLVLVALHKNLAKFTEEILKGKLHFLRSVIPQIESSVLFHFNLRLYIIPGVARIIF